MKLQVVNAEVAVGGNPGSCLGLSGCRSPSQPRLLSSHLAHTSITDSRPHDPPPPECLDHHRRKSLGEEPQAMQKSTDATLNRNGRSTMLLKGLTSHASSGHTLQGHSGPAAEKNPMQAVKPFHHRCQGRQLSCCHASPAPLYSNRGAIPLPISPVEAPGPTPELPLNTPPKSHLPHVGKLGDHACSSHKQRHVPVVDKTPALAHGFQRVLDHALHILALALAPGPDQRAESVVSLPMSPNNALAPLVYSHNPHQS
mmetsp:Transcript_52156/g.138036  ORF Transcript_52156/g.138036 Transcript_52156/m.138036 type:complete len:256 (-) Transcript_52156:8-775(-)